MATAIASKLGRAEDSHSLQRGLVRIPAGLNTLADFRAWLQSPDFPEHVKATFLGKEFYLDMSQEELETHAAVKAEVSRVLLNLNHDLELGKFYLDGVLIVNEEAGVTNNPDGVAVFWESLELGRVVLRERDGKILEIEGNPDWTLEIVSDSSVRKDLVELPKKYHRARIREYWLIDARGPHIVFRMFTWRKKGYREIQPKDGWLHSPVFGRRFRLTRKTDRAGFWEYSLEMKE